MDCDWKDTASVLLMVFLLVLLFFAALFGYNQAISLYKEYSATKQAKEAGTLVESIGFVAEQGKVYMEFKSENLDDGDSIKKVIYSVHPIEHYKPDGDAMYIIQRDDGDLELYASDAQLKALLEQQDFTELTTAQVDLIYSILLPDKQEYIGIPLFPIIVHS